MENEKRKSAPEPEENDIGVREMKKALKAQQEFEDAMDRGEFSLKDMQLIKNFFVYFKPYIKIFLLAILLDVFITFGFVFLPRIQGWIINDLTNPGLSTQTITNHVIGYGAGAAALAIITTISMYYNGLIFNTIGQRIIRDIRNDLFAHVESLSIAQINALPVGKYITRITNDCRGLGLFFTDMIVAVVRDFLNIVMTIIISFSLSWKLALIFLAFLPLIFGVSYFFRKKTKKYFREQRRGRSEINGFLSESIYGIRTIKIFNREELKEKEFKEKNDALRRSYLKQIDIFSFYRPLMFFLQMAGVVLVLYFGVSFVLYKDTVPFSNNVFSSGDLYNFYGYTTSFFQPIQDLAEQLNSVQNILTSAERVGALMSVKPSVEDSPEAKDLETLEKDNPLAKAYPNIKSVIKGDIEFRHVWFAYVGQEWVLKDVSFHIYPGQTAAFVGATGAGKSTIIGLIVRNNIPQKGDIYIDGINIKDIKIDSLRSNISQMMQDVFLFSGTIADNICLFSEKLDKERMINACHLVGANTFIGSLPKGYDSEVRERGNNFSVGQKQLISFARAVYHKPSVMVLDEATANIDTETEELIQNSLKKLRTLGTMVIVAHRLSTIKDVNNIYVVEKGQIVEQGTHQQLIDKGGVYYSMFKLQNLERTINR